MKTMQGFRGLLFLVHFLLVSIFSRAQVTEEWVARFSASESNFGEEATDLAVDDKGNVYVTGGAMGTGTSTSYDYITIKYNSGGVMQWITRYNGPGNGYDGAAAIAVDEKGNVYVTGVSEGIGSRRDYATIKYNSAGLQKWVARYNGPGGSDDGAQALLVDDDENVYVTGSSVGSGTKGDDYATIKYGPNGVPKWISRYNGPGNSTDRASSIALDNKGNVLVTGQSIGGSGFDYATVKYNSSGIQKWVARFNGAANNFDYARSVAVDKSGNVYVTGNTTSGFIPAEPFEMPLLDIATVKYNAAGTQQWVAIHDETGGSDFGISVKLDAAGNPYVMGELSNSPPTVEEPDLDFGVIKYNPAGDKLWVAKYGPPPGQDFNEYSLNDAAIDKTGNVYVVGQSGQIEFATVKFDKNGALQWAVTYKNGVNQIPIGIAVDHLGNVYITGNSDNVDSLGSYDFTTIKYSQYTCGKDGNKYVVCHKGEKTVCLKMSDVKEHLYHGDKLGECPKPDCAVPARISQLPENDNNTGVSGKFQVRVAPNPAASGTKIYYELPVDGRVSIRVFDMLGRQVATLEDAARSAGNHNTDFNVTNIPTGMYTYQIMIKTAKSSWYQTGKISVIK